MASKKSLPTAQTDPVSEPAHIAVGREIAEGHGARAAAAWEVLKNPQMTKEDGLDVIEVPFEIGIFLQSQMIPDAKGELVDTVSRADEEAYERYVELWKQHRAERWPTAAVSCYLTLGGVPFPEKKAEALRLRARADHLMRHHAELAAAHKKALARG